MRRISWLPLFVAAIALCCDWDYDIWMIRSKDADPLYRFVRGDKAGYIDQKGKVVIQPKLPYTGNYSGEFHEGRLEIGVSDGVYVDTTGKVVIDGSHPYRGWDFSDVPRISMALSASSLLT